MSKGMSHKGRRYHAVKIKTGKKPRPSCSAPASGSISCDEFKAACDKTVGKYVRTGGYDPVLETTLQAVFLEAWLACSKMKQNV